MLKTLKGIFCMSALCISVTAYSRQPVVNILTWYGYLDSEQTEIHEAEKLCNVTISFDDYNTNNDFLQRWNNSNFNYDILIYSDTISSIVDPQINLSESTLYKLSNNYDPIIKKNYDLLDLPHNVAIFQLSFSGFLYNPMNIDINPSDSLSDIFKKADNKMVVMMDDPTEADLLLSIATKGQINIEKNPNDLVPLTIANLNKLFQSAIVLFTNTPETIVNLPNFAFAYMWSGDAIALVDKHPTLKYYIDPKLSYITSDLIAEKNLKPTTQCVASYLAGKKFTTNIQNVSYYFSPYGDYGDAESATYNALYKEYSSKINSLPWLHPLQPEHYNYITRTWELIKLQVNEQN